jgi:hypothetical protein
LPSLWHTVARLPSQTSAPGVQLLDTQPAEVELKALQCVPALQVV